MEGTARRGRRSWRRRLGLAAATVGILLAALVAAGAVVGCCVYSVRPYRGTPSDHFDGETFHNLDGAELETGFNAFLRWQFTREEGPWVPWTDAPPGKAPPRAVAAGGMRVTFVNHATVLIQMDGLNFLTDPVWSDRVSPVKFAGPKRVRPPGIRFEDLPPIHAVLLSHNHYDHMDVATLRRLHETHHPRFFVALGNRPFLEGEGIAGVTEMDWWDGREVAPGVVVHSVPAKHFSNRGACDRNRTLWTGYVVKGPAGAAYFAGDTGMGMHFDLIGERFGPLRLAALPIGAYLPRWFMDPVHISPEQAVLAHHAVKARTSVAMHFGTFRLGDDGQDRPVEDLEAYLATAGAARPRFWVLGFGEGRDVPPVTAE